MWCFNFAIFLLRQEYVRGRNRYRGTWYSRTWCAVHGVRFVTYTRKQRNERVRTATSLPFGTHFIISEEPTSRSHRWVVSTTGAILGTWKRKVSIFPWIGHSPFCLLCCFADVLCVCLLVVSFVRPLPFLAVVDCWLLIVTGSDTTCWQKRRLNKSCYCSIIQCWAAQFRLLAFCCWCSHWKAHYCWLLIVDCWFFSSPTFASVSLLTATCVCLDVRTAAYLWRL